MIPERKKILFFLPNLKYGGAERVISFVAQNLNKELFDTTLIIIGMEKERAFDTPEVPTLFLNKHRVFTSIPTLFAILWRKKPDIAISAIGHLNITMALLSVFFRKIVFIGREVNVISILKNYSDINSKRHLPLLTVLSYRLLDKIICQSRDMVEDLRENYRLNPDKLILINNPITKNFKLTNRDKKGVNSISRFITVGRLAKQKGHLRILEALAQTQISYKYTIIGDGPEKDSILTKIEELGLKDHIEYIAFTDKVPEYLSASDLFLQGSYVEGFPNALLESCAVGTPVLAFKAKGGIDEIIVAGKNGFIVEDLPNFIAKLNEFAASKERWSALEISESVFKKYSPELILSKYEKLFLE